MDTTRTESAIGDASTRAHSTTDRLASRAHDTVDQVTGVAQRAAEKLSENSEQWLAAKDEMMDSVRSYVRERPLAALGTALAIGYLLSRLSR